jgi:hypothetical protein
MQDDQALKIVRGELDRSSTTMRCQAAVPEPGHFAGFNRSLERFQGISDFLDLTPDELESASEA